MKLLFNQIQILLAISTHTLVQTGILSIRLIGVGDQHFEILERPPPNLETRTVKT